MTTGQFLTSQPAPAPARDFTASQQLTARLTEVIPGGAHTYAKGADQYPEGMAPVIERGEGAYVWDADGNRFLEFGSGLRAVSLGHVHPGVTGAVRRALELGTNYTRPSRMELDAAQKLLSIVPGAEMVKFAKNGSDVTTAAVKLARAATGRQLVAICRDQPFFSVDDWFIGSTPMAAGIPAHTRELTVSFPYGDLEATAAVFAEHRGQIACLILEAATVTDPPPGFLPGLRALCDDHGIVFVLDEMITGFRWALGGAQEVYGIQPDLATFGKALGNGFAVSALVGRRDLMELGGMDHDQDRVFLLSTTHGAETHSLAAAMAVIDAYREEDVIATLHQRGERLAAGVTAATAAAGVADQVFVLGRASNLIFVTLDADGARSQPFRTLFMQELMARGVLGPSFVVSAAMTEADIDQAVAAVHDACLVYRRALDEGPDGYLHGRPVRPALRARH